MCSPGGAAPTYIDSSLECFSTALGRHFPGSLQGFRRPQSRGTALYCRSGCRPIRIAGASARTPSEHAESAASSVAAQFLGDLMQAHRETFEAPDWAACAHAARAGRRRSRPRRFQTGSATRRLEEKHKARRHTVLSQARWRAGHRPRGAPRVRLPRPRQAPHKLGVFAAPAPSATQTGCHTNWVVRTVLTKSDSDSRLRRDPRPRRGRVCICDSDMRPAPRAPANPAHWRADARDRDGDAAPAVRRQGDPAPALGNPDAPRDTSRPPGGSPRTGMSPPIAGERRLRREASESRAGTVTWQGRRFRPGPPAAGRPRVARRRSATRRDPAPLSPGKLRRNHHDEYQIICQWPGPTRTGKFKLLLCRNRRGAAGPQPWRHPMRAGGCRH